MPRMPIGRYTVEHKLGAGGMGEVFAARDPSLDRLVALKLVKPRRAEDAEQAGARLRREAQALARLSHPNVVPVFDAGAHGNRIFIAMELVDGQTLTRWNEQSRPWSERLRVLLEAGRGLGAAHRAGVVHRDFKPSNVMVGDDGRARVLDFGLARDLEAHPSTDLGLGPSSSRVSGDSVRSGSLTEDGVIMGTPQYMAPEQFLDREIDARSDQFSFCVVAYRMLYGQRPFDGRGYKQLRREVLAGTPKDPPRGTAVPGAVWRVLRRGLSLQPHDRFASMAAVLEALQRAIRRRRPWMFGAGLGALACAAGAVAIAAGPSDEQRCDRVQARAATVWSDVQRTEVRRAFTATELPYAAAALDEVDSRLTHYVDGWAQHRTAACEAVLAQGPSADGIDHQIRCLERRIASVEALVEQFEAGGKATVEHAPVAMQQLRPPQGCDADASVTGATPAPDASVMAQVLALEATLDAVEARVLTGQAHQALAPAIAAADRARAVGYGPVEARALRLLGRAQRLAGDSKAARTAFDAAILASAAADDLHGEIETSLDLIDVLAGDLSEPAAALTLAHQTEALLLRIDSPPLLRAQLSRRTGSAHQQAGDLDQAELHLRRVLQTPATHAFASVRAAATESLAVVLSRRGRYQESVPLLQASQAELEALVGPDHPRVAKVIGNLGSSLRQLGRLPESQAALERAIAIYTRANGPHARGMEVLLHNLGILQRSQHDPAAARETLARAITLMVENRGPDHPSLAWVQSDLGTLLFMDGEPEQSLPHLREAVRIFEATQGSQAPGLVFALGSLIQNLLALDRPAEALPHVEQGLRALQAQSVDPAGAGALRYASALALWQANVDRSRALTLGRQAIEDMKASERPMDEHIETITAWVREHDAAQG